MSVTYAHVSKMVRTEKTVQAKRKSKKTWDNAIDVLSIPRLLSALCVNVPAAKLASLKGANKSNKTNSDVLFACILTLLEQPLSIKVK